MYNELTREFGTPAYERIDAPATLAQKEILKKLTPEKLDAHELAGEKILKTLTVAPGNGAPIGGIKVIAESGWFAARPSGTEEVYKIYAESFRGADHLHRIQAEAQELIARVFKQAESSKGLRNQLAGESHHTLHQRRIVVVQVCAVLDFRRHGIGYRRRRGGSNRIERR